MPGYIVPPPPTFSRSKNVTSPFYGSVVARKKETCFIAVKGNLQKQSICNRKEVHFFGAYENHDENALLLTTVKKVGSICK
jgi:hypothetical protein